MGAGPGGCSVSRGKRLAVAIALVAAFGGGATAIVANIVLASPAYINYAAGHVVGTPVNMTIQSDGTTGFGPLAGSVTFMAKAPDGKWVHSTLWQLPADSVIHVKAYEYDTGDAFRNQFMSQVTGVIGGHIDLVSTKASGKVTTLNESLNSYNSNVFPYVGHSFSVPSLGINVPLKGLSPATPLNFLCAAAPCSPTYDHTLTTFSFKTPGPGLYHWQCFIPCGFSYFDGQGGPMATIGYMTGFLRVVN